MIKYTLFCIKNDGLNDQGFPYILPLTIGKEYPLEKHPMTGEDTTKDGYYLIKNDNGIYHKFDIERHKEWFILVAE